MSQAMQSPTGVSITPSDTVANWFRAVYVGVTGDVTIKDGAGTSLLFKGAPAGTLLPVMTSKVMSTGTTATNLIGIP